MATLLEEEPIKNYPSQVYTFWPNKATWVLNLSPKLHTPDLFKLAPYTHTVHFIFD